VAVQSWIVNAARNCRASKLRAWSTHPAPGMRSTVFTWRAGFKGMRRRGPHGMLFWSHRELWRTPALSSRLRRRIPLGRIPLGPDLMNLDEYL
jgi:hypothetical protein